jgi:DMSO/TMAO reductase YedYZ molybdopterin-dependent catalytic subunit
MAGRRRVSYLCGVGIVPSAGSPDQTRGASGYRRLRRLAEPPPGPFRRDFWRSPLRGPWLTSFLGTLLLPLIVIVAVTGLISDGAYQPGLGLNSPFDRYGALDVLIHLPASSPAWIYAVTQGLHITVGLVAIPLLLAKLWSVIPRLFAWPPARGLGHLVERASLLLLVGGALFEFATGVLNIQVFYPWHFNFVREHYYGAWVFVAALTAHVLVKLPTIVHSYRALGFLRPLRDDLLHTRPEPAHLGSLVPVAPAAPTLSRRGLLGLVGGASAALLLVNLGESVGGPLRRLALLAPRGRDFGTGPNDFQVNKTALAAGVIAAARDPQWKLTVRGARKMRLDREALLRLPQHSYDLPIACVEGWSTTQRWTGVRLVDLADLVAATREASMHAASFQRGGAFRQATFTAAQVRDSRSLLALRVNGADLSLDHGYPARIIVPAVPGVHCTKWIGSLTFSNA